MYTLSLIDQTTQKYTPTNNKILPTRLPPMEGQQKKIQYPGWHKDTTRKGLWSEADDEISQGDRKVRGNINNV